jgi:membrane protease YdiL (CAAX protease family)
MSTHQPNHLAEQLLADRHSVWLTLSLHLIPGVLIVAVYLLIAAPLTKFLGLPPFLGWAIAMCVALAPVELGLLLWLSFLRNDRFSLHGVVHFMDRPISRGKLVALVIVLIVWFLAISIALLPMDEFIYKSLFRWVPWEGAGGDISAPLKGYPRSVMIMSLGLCIPLTGLLLPYVEELYFRGFLMPRLPVAGRWTPVLSSILFSLYHFWTPWGLLSRVAYLLPAFIFVWRTKDLRVSIGAHVGTTFIMQTVGTVVLMLNLI